MQSRVTSGGSSIPKKGQSLFFLFCLTQGGGGGRVARISIINLGDWGERGGG